VRHYSKEGRFNYEGMIFMSMQQTYLFPFYKGWDAYQELLIKAVAPLSSAQLGLRAAPHLRSIGENTAHIIGARAGWFHMLMGEGDAEITAMDTWDLPGAPERSAAELVRGLEATWQMIRDALMRWTPADLDYIFERTHHGEEERFTRQWIIWHVIEHDLHHGGEISLMLGMHNLAAPDL
jgi:uncharacterized damage-inducible protein DinB